MPYSARQDVTRLSPPLLPFLCHRSQIYVDVMSLLAITTIVPTMALFFRGFILDCFAFDHIPIFPLNSLVTFSTVPRFTISNHGYVASS
jgi:hypothetical protein